MIFELLSASFGMPGPSRGSKASEKRVDIQDAIIRSEVSFTRQGLGRLQGHDVTVLDWVCLALEFYHTTFVLPSHCLIAVGVQSPSLLIFWHLE